MDSFDHPAVRNLSRTKGRWPHSGGIVRSPRRLVVDVCERRKHRGGLSRRLSDHAVGDAYTICTPRCRSWRGRCGWIDSGRAAHGYISRLLLLDGQLQLSGSPRVFEFLYAISSGIAGVFLLAGRRPAPKRTGIVEGCDEAGPCHCRPRCETHNLKESGFSQRLKSIRKQFLAFLREPVIRYLSHASNLRQLVPVALFMAQNVMM